MEFESQAFQVAEATWISDRTVSKAKMEWKQAFKLMEEIQLRSQLVSFKAWLWASATVSSRALHVPWDCAGCLCPVGDLFNYDAPSDEEQEAGISCLHEPPDTSPRLTDGGYEEALDSYCFYARKGYKKGDQVLLGYGTYTNLELLEHYGFLLNLNPNDKAFISLEAPIQVSDWPNDSLYVQPNGRPSFSLISALRLSLTPKILRRSVGHLAHSGNQLSVDNEVSVMRFLARCCQNALQNLPTSVEDDIILLDGIERSLSNFAIKDFIAIRSCSNEIEIFLQANNINIDQSTSAASLPSKARRSMERWRLAVQWRVIYKTSLLNCISFCNKVIKSLADHL